MNTFFQECDRLGAEVARRSIVWHQPVRVPNLRIAALVGVACALSTLSAVFL